MKTFFDRFFFVRRKPAVSVRVCNYANNYYGDQHCQWVTLQE